MMRAKQLVALMVCVAAIPAAADTAHTPAMTVSLEGQWKFITDPANAGSQKGWHTPGYDDAAWGVINVPGIWEDQGYTQDNPSWTEDRLNKPYSGYAWYRRTIIVPADWKGRKVFLNLGYIDDLDWTYVNGTMVGSTTTIGQPASDIARSYPVPEGIVKFGQPNLIVVRVLDKLGDGGITRGPVTLSAETPQSYAGGAAGRATGNDSVRIGSGVVVEKGETTGDAVAILGTVLVRGHVTGDAVAVMGSVVVEPGGRVDGDAVAVGGSVRQKEGATIRGSVTQVGGGLPLPAIPGLPGGSPAITALGGFILSLLFAVVAAVVVALFPDRMEMMATTVLGRPAYCAGSALAAAFAILLIGGSLVVTIIGIPLVFVLALFAMAGVLAGQVAVRLAVGRKLAEAAGRPGMSIILATVTGSVVLAVLKLVPYAGFVLLSVLGLLGFGAVVATGFGARPDWLSHRLGWQAPPPPAPPAPYGPS